MAAANTCKERESVEKRQKKQKRTKGASLPYLFLDGELHLDTLGVGLSPNEPSVHQADL